MGWYQQKIFPVMIDRGMRNPSMTKYRPQIAPLASKTVLEVGVGSGLNFPHYTDQVDRLYGLEPSPELIEKARPMAENVAFPVDFLPNPAEDIPLEDNSVDTVLSSWTLCSIPEIKTALKEMRRVLKPDGRFIFIEHGLAPDANIQKWQRRLVPVFRVLAGCDIARKMDELIAEAGFEFDELENKYLDGPKFIAYHFIGQAHQKNEGE